MAAAMAAAFASSGRVGTPSSACASSCREGVRPARPGPSTRAGGGGSSTGSPRPRRNMGRSARVATSGPSAVASAASAPPTASPTARPPALLRGTPAAKRSSVGSRLRTMKRSAGQLRATRPSSTGAHTPSPGAAAAGLKGLLGRRRTAACPRSSAPATRAPRTPRGSSAPP